MFDKEIEAIAKCTELVKELNDDSKVRVVKYLIERFGIGSQASPSSYPNQQSNHFNPNNTNLPLLNSNAEQFADFTETKNEDYPTLKDLLIKNYPKTETEWILCYAFYSSKYGTDTFKKDDILEKYKENNRLSNSTGANLSNNINSCVKKDWLKSINASDFVVKEEGLTYVKEILRGKSISKEVKSSKRKTVQKSES